jgi:acyl transferase domain-containing protein
MMTGQGSQYVGMGEGLYRSSPVFRESLDDCAGILDTYLDVPLLEVMFAGAEGEHGLLLDDTRYTQPALFALHYALARLWMSWGIEPGILL